MPIVRTPQAKVYLEKLRERLPESRVSHCIFVAEYLSSFAPGIGLDHDDAVAAGLLHDYCRDYGQEQFLTEARALRLPLSETHLQKPSLLHGPLAAELCRREFGISDAVHEAIYWHTTGRPGLGRLGQALYVSDFSEPTRKFPEAAEARNLLRQHGFGAALLYVVETRISMNRGRTVVDPNTEAFLIWLKTRA